MPGMSSPPVEPVPVQTTLELGVPLSEVTFCVVDLETTGGSVVDDAITEIGAVKMRGGERLGSFQALVDPRRPIPPAVAHLTGIDDRMVSGRPPIEQVLPSFLEFVRGSVFVAHNAGFDFGFLNASCDRLDYAPLPGPPLCTARLARRVVWPDVPNVRLATLARYFRTRATPSHRALDDAEACAEVLHGLLDLATRLGIRTIGELELALRARGRPNFGKIVLADHLPHAPGVYVFRDRGGRVLYVGKANDLRDRVRSYFYGDDRKKVTNLLEEVRSVDGIRCAGELEALVVEARLIRRYEPTYNRRGTTWRRAAYVALDTGEAWPRLKIVRSAKPHDRRLVLGPFGTSAAATLAKEALEEVAPIRRCTTSMRLGTRFPPCALGDIGRCLAPCDGRTGPERYGELVRWLASSLADSPDELLAALERRMRRLAEAERFEEAASVRDRLRSLAESLSRARADRWLLGAGRLDLRTGDGSVLRLDRGALLTPGAGGEPIDGPIPRERADEIGAVRSWVSKHRPRVDACDRELAEPVDGGATLARLLATLRDASSARARSRRREPRG
jgi:DNA polymerase-3 subunit epsilon